MRFDATLRERWLQTADGWRFDMPEGWMQGRSVFGALTAAAAVGLALRQTPQPCGMLRVMTVQLLRPTLAGPLQGSSRLTRQGKNVAFSETRLSQEGQQVALANLVFGSPRQDATPVAPAACWRGPEPDSLVDLPYLAGITPEFTQHIALRWADGGPPFSGAEEARIAGYCRFRAPAGDVEGVLGLLDAWPCPSLSILDAPAWASTVSWTVHIHQVPDDFDGWFAFDYHTVAGADGFHTSVARLHDHRGKLVAWSEQLVAVFERADRPHP